MSDDPVPPELESDEIPEQMETDQLRVQSRMAPIEPRGFQPQGDIIKEHEAKTARTIALALLWMLGLSILIQYVTTAVLVVEGKADATATFEHLFNTVLPVLAGLTGSAVTYYLTKEKK